MGNNVEGCIVDNFEVKYLAIPEYTDVREDDKQVKAITTHNCHMALVKRWGWPQGLSLVVERQTKRAYCLSTTRWRQLKGLHNMSESW
jgi:hypothetical protein